MSVTVDGDFRSGRLNAALGWAAKGVRVFPSHSTDKQGRCTCGNPQCDNPGKHPRIKDWPNQATTNAKQIEAWWRRWPGANIVGISGEAFDVVDVEPQHVAAFKKLGIDLSDYPCHETSRGGLHYFVTAEGFVGQLPGLGEIKGLGGCIHLPPSKIGERSYRELTELNGDLRPLPTVLRDRLVPWAQADKRGPKPSTPAKFTVKRVKRAAQNSKKAKDSTFSTADEANPRSVEWWWDQHIAVGKMGLLDGDPGLGKSVILCDFIASATAGRELPDGSRPLQVGGAVLFAAEDGYEDTIVPRLIAAGADLSKVVVAHSADQGNAISLPQDLKILDQLIDGIGAVLVAFDPWEFYLEADIIKGREQRKAFEPVKQLIAEKRAVLLGSRHLNQQSGQRALYRGRGDITAIGMSRYGFIVGPDPQSEEQRVDRVMVPLKFNLAPESRVHAVRYRVEEVTLDVTDQDGKVITAPRIKWNGRSDVTADQAVDSQTAQRLTAKQIMETKILPLIQDEGPIKSDQGWSIMQSFGISGRAAVNSARQHYRIQTVKEGMSGPWWWFLDGQEDLLPFTLPTVKVRKVPNR